MTRSFLDELAELLFAITSGCSIGEGFQDALSVVTGRVFVIKQNLH
jgi:hypothetical protein